MDWQKWIKWAIFGIKWSFFAIKMANFSIKMAHFCHKNGLNPPRLAGSAGKWIKMDWKADFMGSGQIRETQRISTVNPRRGVAEAPSAGAQTPRTQAISTVCAKRGAAEGDPRRPWPGGAEPLQKWIGRRIPWDPARSAKLNEFPLLIREGGSPRRPRRAPKPD